MQNNGASGIFNLKSWIKTIFFSEQNELSKNFGEILTDSTKMWKTALAGFIFLKTYFLYMM